MTFARDNKNHQGNRHNWLVESSSTSQYTRGGVNSPEEERSKRCLITLTLMPSIGMPTSPKPPKKTNRIQPTNDIKAITNTGKESCGTAKHRHRNRHRRFVLSKRRQTSAEKRKAEVTHQWETHTWAYVLQHVCLLISNTRAVLLIKMDGTQRLIDKRGTHDIFAGTKTQQPPRMHATNNSAATTSVTASAA